MEIVSKQGNQYVREIWSRIMTIKGRPGSKLLAISPKYPSRFSASMHPWQSEDFTRASKITDA